MFATRQKVIPISSALLRWSAAFTPLQPPITERFQSKPNGDWRTRLLKRRERRAPGEKPLSSLIVMRKALQPVKKAAPAFTLLEIMIVIAIMGIVLSAGVPMMSRAFKSNELGKAVNDVIEGCKTARDRAILQGVPYEFVIKEGGDLSVEAARDNDPNRSGHPKSSDSLGTPNAHVAEWVTADFPRKLGEHVAIELIDVNFIDHMGEEEARVRFYPNGTSDEFTNVMASAKEGQRQVSLDVVTGLADEVVR